MEKYKLVNPERCEECGKPAKWQVVEDDVNRYLCDDHLIDSNEGEKKKG